MLCTWNVELKARYRNSKLGLQNNFFVSAVQDSAMYTMGVAIVGLVGAAQFSI